MPATKKIDPFARKWVKAVREALGLTQDELGEKLNTKDGGRDTVAKWEGGSREPGFGYTRKIAKMAPPTLALEFIGRSTESNGVSDPDRNVAGTNNAGEKTVTTPEGIMVGRELDEIEDSQVRKRARTAALAAIDAERSKSHPSEPGAEKKAGPRSAHS